MPFRESFDCLWCGRQYGVRDPADLEGWAQAELRSVNGQIEYILRQAVNKRKEEKDVPPPPAEGPEEK